jgi:hypothetical protein
VQVNGLILAADTVGEPAERKLMYQQTLNIAIMGKACPIIL